MLSYEVILAILIAHFIGDFVLQTDWMAINKSKKFLPLTVHVGVYSACLLPFGLTYAVVNGLAHWATDAVTSRVSSHYWAKGRRGTFFMVVGFDQLIHYATLFGTYNG